MAEPGRRTVVIRGQVADRYTPRRSVVHPSDLEPRPRRSNGRPADGVVRPNGNGSSRSLATGEPVRRYSGASRSSSRRRRPYDPPRSRPDRIAMWAVLLGIILLLAAATSSHAAVAHLVHAAHLHLR
jgi:hypothetical protein